MKVSGANNSIRYHDTVLSHGFILDTSVIYNSYDATSHDSFHVHLNVHRTLGRKSVSIYCLDINPCFLVNLTMSRVYAAILVTLIGKILAAWCIILTLYACLVVAVCCFSNPNSQEWSIRMRYTVSSYFVRAILYFDSL